MNINHLINQNLKDLINYIVENKKILYNIHLDNTGINVLFSIEHMLIKICIHDYMTKISFNLFYGRYHTQRIL